MATPALPGDGQGVGRSLAEGLAETTTAIYRRLEALLIAHMAKQIKAPESDQTWVEAKLAAIQKLRSLAEGLLAIADGEMQQSVEQAIALAWQRGGQAAIEEMARYSGVSPAEAARIRQALPGADAITRLVWSAVTTLRGTHTPILRWTLDSYRTVVSAYATGTLAGTHTRLRSAQIAWEELIGRGITGFTDKAGRRWELASYVEMAMRTVTAQAAVEGHLDRLSALGVDLVIVSNAPQECVRCRPWEGKVLSRRLGGARTVEMEHTTRDGVMVPVEVAGSVTEAVAAGLMHPNCRHSLSAYLPGVTRPLTRTADPAGDKAQQRLRALERAVRAAKREEAGALTPEAKKAAAAKVRGYQAMIRDHVAETGLFRQRHREQIGTAR
jgi:hypothetical protein